MLVEWKKEEKGEKIQRIIVVLPKAGILGSKYSL
jgi:hypothetical protein